MNLEVRLGNRRLRDEAARAELEKALDQLDGDDVDALWWRDGREGPWSVFLFLPRTRTNRYRSASLSHASWPQLKKDLRRLGLESTIRRDEVKVA